MSNKRLTILIILIFISGIISGFVFGLINGYILKEKIQDIIGKKNVATSEEQKITKFATADNIAAPNQKLSITGKINEINNNEILINNEQGANIKIILDQNTLYKKYNLAAEDNQGVDFNISDLKNGDEITILSADDIKDKTEFTAKQINFYYEE